MADKSFTEFDARDIPWQRSPGHQNIYVNNAGVATTTHDIQIRVAQMSTVEGKPVNQEIATIFMAPGQAKAMALVLLRTVSEYEDKHKIVLPLPDHLTTGFAGVVADAVKAKISKK